ncbi:hypothetical protein [Catenuloplanes japonicus]|uniref:hypothetical protein n=1 Tax=Catenuloplanes japonicus TaxID=33876 RepID=UPI000526ECD7|nr:hypothetical protein [Catenuloplanes japonicus]
MSLEKVLDAPLLKNTRTLVGTITASMFLVSLLVGLVATSGVRAWSPRVYIGILSTLCLTLIVAGLLGWRFVVRRYDPAFYRIILLEGCMDVEPSGTYRKYRYRRRQQIEATRDNLRLVEFREHWTGAGSPGGPKIELIRPGGGKLLDGGHPEEDGRVHRWVYPGRSLGRGEPLDVEVLQTHSDNVTPQRPYFCQGGGRYQTDEVRVEVRFPVDYEPTEISGAVWNTAGRVMRRQQKIGKIEFERTRDNAGGVIYTVVQKNPRLHHSYGLMREWPNSRKPIPAKQR